MAPTLQRIPLWWTPRPNLFVYTLFLKIRNVLVVSCPRLPELLNWHWLKVKGNCVAHFSKTIFISFAMSLLIVPSVRFPSVASSPTCSLSRPSASSTLLERSRINPCASAHRSGMWGCLANSTPHTVPGWLRPSGKASLLTPPDSHSVVVAQTVGEPAW